MSSKLDQPTVIGSENVFLDRPISLPAFSLHAYGAQSTRTPTLDEWQAAFLLATSSQESSPYWVGDLLAYAESRPDWQSKLDQAKAVTGLSHQTLLNQAYISTHVAKPERELAPTYSHAAAVARLAPAEQVSLLTSARAYGWTVPRLRRAVRLVRPARTMEPEPATQHTVDVTVRLTVDASSSWEAQERAWQRIKDAISAIGHAHVISATALNPEPVEPSYAKI